MFGNLSKLETFRVGGAEIRTTDALAVGLIGWASWRAKMARERLDTAQTPQAKNALISPWDEAEQDFYRYLAVAAALIVLPRLLLD